MSGEAWFEVFAFIGEQEFKVSRILTNNRDAILRQFETAEAFEAGEESIFLAFLDRIPRDKKTWDNYQSFKTTRGRRTEEQQIIRLAYQSLRRRLKRWMNSAKAELFEVIEPEPETESEPEPESQQPVAQPSSLDLESADEQSESSVDEERSEYSSSDDKPKRKRKIAKKKPAKKSAAKKPAAWQPPVVVRKSSALTVLSEESGSDEESQNEESQNEESGGDGNNFGAAEQHSETESADSNGEEKEELEKVEFEIFVKQRFGRRSTDQEYQLRRRSEGPVTVDMVEDDIKLDAPLFVDLRTLKIHRFDDKK